MKNKEFKKLLYFLESSFVFEDGITYRVTNYTTTEDLRKWAELIGKILYGDIILVDKNKLKDSFYSLEIKEDIRLGSIVKGKEFHFKAETFIDKVTFIKEKHNKEFMEYIDDSLNNKLIQEFEKEFKVEEDE